MNIKEGSREDSVNIKGGSRKDSLNIKGGFRIKGFKTGALLGYVRLSLSPSRSAGFYS